MGFLTSTAIRFAMEIFLFVHILLLGIVCSYICMVKKPISSIFVPPECCEKNLLPIFSSTISSLKMIL
jgi:hypothetical protein